jgi:beta-lactamase class D
VPALSTFKIPLALMAFDSNILQDENTTYKWDGTKSDITAWNQDQTAATWMRDSVVWYSQLITHKLGAEEIKNYLKIFNYGNQDFSGGLTTAWLSTKNPGGTRGSASLKISAHEQLEFLKAFYKQSFKVSSHAYEKTKLITQLEPLPHDYNFSGKTGSGYIGPNSRTRLGWFLARIEGHGNEIITVLKLVDDDPQSLGRLAGPQAKEMTLKILKSNGL